MSRDKKEFTGLFNEFLNHNPYVDRSQFRKSIKVDLSKQNNLPQNNLSRGNESREKEEMEHTF